MTNYEKIKLALDKTKLVAIRNKNGWTVFNYVSPNGDIRGSFWWSDIEDCYVSLGINHFSEKELNKIDIQEIKIIPIKPRVLKVGQKVNILDCSIIGDYEGWEDEHKELKSGEIESVCDNSGGVYYGIYNKDKSDWWFFPAYVITPIEIEEDATTQAIEMLKSKGFKIIKE